MRGVAPACWRASLGAAPLANPPPLRLQGDIALNLAWAVVESSVAPLLLLDGDLRVVVASASFCTAFDLEQNAVEGRYFSQLGVGEWGDTRLTALLATAASGDAAFEAFELSLLRDNKPPRQLILNAHRLNYTDAGDARVILGLFDATEARMADQLRDHILRETALLLQEVRHRVANSLQIIAGVLLHSARHVQSEDARRHLQVAHHRIMAVAALERQLCTAALGQVVVQTYITQLCASLADAMISDPEQIVLEVVIDDSVVDAEMSISLGLITTELVINALKYAFPGGRQGKVTVTYESQGDNWTLTVRDDGVGYTIRPNAERSGLGTAIVEGLARQKDALVLMSNARPGTEISIVHMGSGTLETQPPAKVASGGEADLVEA